MFKQFLFIKIRLLTLVTSVMQIQKPFFRMRSLLSEYGYRIYLRDIANLEEDTPFA